MNHIDLFSGIGGFALAASCVWGEDHNILTFCEKELFPQKVLKKHWPDVPIVDDIFKMKGSDYGTDVTLLTGGFPCQPFSHAGKRKGTEDDRYLWPEMLRVIKETKPKYIIGENVYGIINIDGGLVFEQVLSDLEIAGYEVTPFIIPACGQNAPHKRDRVWIVGKRIEALADTNQVGWIRIQQQSGLFQEKNQKSSHATCCIGPSRRENKIWSTWEIEPGVGRVADGIPSRVDRVKGLGNAIVPQVVVPIMQAIKEIEDQN